MKAKSKTTPTKEKWMRIDMGIFSSARKTTGNYIVLKDKSISHFVLVGLGWRQIRFAGEPRLADTSLGTPVLNLALPSMVPYHRAEYPSR
jgi:hypothetical protein